MRKITKEAAMAFANHERFNKANTTVNCSFGNSKMYLHGNLIAWNEGAKVFFSLCGWNTNTTRQRLNGLFEVLGITNRVVSRNGKAFLVSKTGGFKTELHNIDGTFYAWTGTPCVNV